MTDAELFKLATTANNEESFLSAVVGIAEEYNGDDWDAANTQMREIYRACNMSFKEIRTAVGLTQTAFADAINAPKRTVENWEHRHEPTDYIKFLLMEYFGIIKREEKNNEN